MREGSAKGGGAIEELPESRAKVGTELSRFCVVTESDSRAS